MVKKFPLLKILIVKKISLLLVLTGSLIFHALALCFIQSRLYQTRSKQDQISQAAIDVFGGQNLEKDELEGLLLIQKSHRSIFQFKTHVGLFVPISFFILSLAAYVFSLFAIFG